MVAVDSMRKVVKESLKITFINGAIEKVITYINQEFIRIISVHGSFMV